MSLGASRSTDLADSLSNSSLSVNLHSILENDLISETEKDLNISYGDEVDPYDLGDSKNEEGKSVLLNIISQAKKEMDLTKITLPTFILERRSLLEMFAEFMAHPDLFKAIPTYDTPLDRMKATLKFYLSTFHAGRRGSIAKKPYNPVLGEYFQCLYKSNNRLDHPKASENSPVEWAQQSDVTYISEQVSHHPPISAMYAECETSGICFNCHLWTKSRFLGFSIGVHMVGEGVLSLLDHNEEYIVTFPSAYGRNIFGVPWFELGGHCKITCPQTGLYCTIDFHTKPLFGGKRHAISAKIFYNDNKTPVMHVSGKWNGVMYRDTNTNPVEFLNTETEHTFRKYVKSLDTQEPNESRKLWINVSDSLKNGNVKDATKYKNLIEEKQRAEAKHRKENKIDYCPKYFKTGKDKSWVYIHPLYKRLNHPFDWKQKS